MKIIIIIPAYNEEKRINKTLESYAKYFKKLKKQKKIDFEILVVLNACSDNTLGVVKKNKFKELSILDLKDGGKGFAIIEGFNYALDGKNDLIGFVDADMATSPEAFYDLIENMGNYDGVIGSRWLKNSKAKRKFIKRITSGGFNFLVRSLFLFSYRDTQCGAKIFRKEVIEKCLGNLELTKWAFDVNLLYVCKRNGFRIKEHPTIWHDQEDSKIANLSKTSIQMFLGVVRLRLIYSFFEPILKPIKFILIMGDKLLNKK